MPSSISDTIIGYISYIQQKQYITIERFRSIRRYFFQSIGFFILLYYVFQLPILFYLFLKFLFCCIIQIFSIIFWLPLKTIELVLPKTDNYNVMFPLFWFCSFLSFLIAKFFQKNLTKRHSFLLTFIIILLLQFLFIILPVATSIKEQRKLSSVPNDVERVIMKLSEMTGQREELTSPNNGIIKNIRARMNKLSTSIGNDIKVGSDVEDGQNMNKGKKTLDLQIFSSEEKEEQLLLKQQANNLVDSSQQFSSKVLENSSEFIQEKKKSFIKSIIFAQKFHNWLNHVWNIFYQIQQFFSRSKLHLPQYNISSIYTAFTDLNCYDYTKSIHRYKQNYIYFLNTYRLQSPFPIYLSIIQSNGPKCYPYYPNSSCAIRSKSLFSHLKRQLFRFIRFWMIISIPITILLFIYHRFQYRQQYKPSNKLSNKTNDLPLQQVSSNNDNNNNNHHHPLDKEIENKLHLWLEQEQNNGYQNISESYRIALNSIFSKQDARLTIETIQFAYAKIRDVSQTSIETIVINAILDIDHLILYVIKDQHFSIRIPKLTGELGILLINNTIDVKFKHIQINNAEIIDPKNTLSSDEKFSIIKLLKEVINQTNVQYCLVLSDNQEKIQSLIPPIESQSFNISSQCETPLSTPINNNHRQTPPPPEREVKKLLVRIVKAVRLHDVEQPFCILELNQPKQIHQTSIAKNGVNPFWDERFLFECNDKSNQIHLRIIDRKKSNKKLNTNLIETIYADVLIPFSYVTSTIYKQDIRITPRYPDSIIRIEFSTLTEEEALVVNHGYGLETPTDSPTCSTVEQEENKIEHDHHQSSSDQILTLTSNVNASPKTYNYENNTHNYPLPRSPPTTADTFSASSPLNSPEHDIQRLKPRKSRSFMNSFRLFSKRKKYEKKIKENDNGLITPTQTNSIPHSLSAEPFVSLNTPNPVPLHRNHSISRSFRNFFRSKKNLNTSNFIIDHPDLLATSTPITKKRSFFRRFKSKQKEQINLSTNSLTSDDCTRRESVRNTPIRANVGRPVIIPKSFIS